MHTISVRRETAELIRDAALVFDLKPVPNGYEFAVDDDVHAALEAISPDMDKAVRAVFAEVR